MIANIIRDYHYLERALLDIAQPMVEMVKPLGTNEYVEISNITYVDNQKVRFTATVQGQSPGDEWSFTIQTGIVQAVISKLNVEDQE
jgi:hypothetical protein